MKKYDVVVVGGANTDYVVKGRRLPQPGETVDGDSFLEAHGGKGANQAVACARLGARVAFIGRVGNDSRGEEALRNLRREGINVSQVGCDPRTPTGVALIMVAADGEKQILTLPGANHRLTIADISACGYLFFEDELGVDWNHYPNVRDWLKRIRAEARWKHPYDLLPGHPIAKRA